MALFPMFLKLDRRRVLVVGAGHVGESKIAGLLDQRADLRVVAPQATARVRRWARAGKIRWAKRPFSQGDMKGVFLVVVATPSAELNDRVARLARRRNVLVNVVDDPERCDFYYPALVRRGPLSIAISTEGQSPAFAGRLRRQLEQDLPPEIGRQVLRLGRERARLFSKSMDPDERRQLLIRLAGKISLGGKDERESVFGRSRARRSGPADGEGSADD